MSVVTIKQLLDSGAHFGHQTRRWNPKMKSFIYTAKAGTHIIDLGQTQAKLDEAYHKMNEIAQNGGKVLFVGTKKQAQQAVLEEALRSGSFFINQRWLGGTLTNFRTIQKSIRRLVEIETMEENGSINVYPKKEIILLRKEATRLENFLGGIKEMKKIPDALFVVDPIEDHIAVLEARKLKIPVFGLVDTNCDPAAVDYMIPANDDAMKTIRLITAVLSDAIVDAKGGVQTVAFVEEGEEDITMKDVIRRVDEQNEARRRQRIEERRQREERRNRQQTFNRNRRTFTKRVEENQATDAPAKEATTVTQGE